MTTAQGCMGSQTGHRGIVAALRERAAIDYLFLFSPSFFCFVKLVPCRSRAGRRFARWSMGRDPESMRGACRGEK